MPSRYTISGFAITARELSKQAHERSLNALKYSEQLATEAEEAAKA